MLQHLLVLCYWLHAFYPRAVLQRFHLINDEAAVIYRCLGQPGKRLKAGAELVFDHGSLRAQVLSGEGEERLVRFDGDEVDENLSRLGVIPLPPYIGRPAEPMDSEWYQTVYAAHPGAVAAPTAGLHFTEELLNRIRALGVSLAFVTLHVGWGTFKPVAEAELQAGRLQEERFRIPTETAQAIEQTKGNGGRVVAVGTTVVRALETAANGCQVSDLAPIQGTTDLFIRPGFQFKVIDALVTNFHLPVTSLLYLVAAFAGEGSVSRAYQEAVKERYRFYSYGDAMLIL